MGIDLPLIWAVIILFGILMYVVMDGFDLGIGILFPFLQAKEDRDVIDVGQRNAGLGQTVADRLARETAPVLDAPEAFLLDGGDERAVDEQRGG